MSVDAVGERLICALDCEDGAEAKAMVERLDGIVSFFKVGIILQAAAGREVVDHLLERGKRVFLDLKYYDIPETVERAVARAAALGVSFLTVHGNAAIIRGAVRGRGDAGLKLLAVTVLTSLDQEDIEDMGYGCRLEELVAHRVRKAREYGCDGVICSPREIETVRREAGGGFLVVTPGIRTELGEGEEHRRFAGPGEAMRRGADYIVVGRPITRAPDPARAALEIIEDMRAGLSA
ncbi:MAG: orotidine-5'-phosphate decarboxylase [Actinobacteria bacterium]|nr:orotidine-5'-phosphate decarboxylase [Actinomycetota bacterium]